MKIIEEYTKKYVNLDDLLNRVQKTINKDTNFINSEFVNTFSMMLLQEPCIYWNEEVYNQTLESLNNLYRNNPNLNIDDDCFEFFLLGYNSYIQLCHTINEFENISMSTDLKIRAFYFPTYTSILESCISNFLRFICILIGLTKNKDYKQQNTLHQLISIVNKHKFNEIGEIIDVNIRNSINHGKFWVSHENGMDFVKFVYSENNKFTSLKLNLYEFEKIIYSSFDATSSILLAIVTFLNSNIDLLNNLKREYIEFELLAMKLSIPSIICTNINSIENNEQINIEIDIDIEETKIEHIKEVAFLLSKIIFKNYDNYDKYMFLFRNPRMLSGWIRFKREELVEISKGNDFKFYEKNNIPRECCIYPSSEEIIDINQVKYFHFSNITTTKYKVKKIEDVSSSDYKRLRTHLFIGDAIDKLEIISMLNDAISKLKVLKNFPNPKAICKHGTMEADAIIINVYRNDGRKNKEISINNVNFVCMVEYNLDGITKLKRGGISEYQWNCLYHDKIDNINIAWREKKYMVKINLNKVGRNELCPCGSNKKYKKCCLCK